MNINELKMDKEQARELYRKYQEHRAWQSPHDEEIAAIYKRIAQGKTVIRALESIRNAGCDADGLPKLAICPAHMTECWYQATGHGQNRTVNFGKRSPNSRDRRNVVRMDWPDAPETKRWTHMAQVPLIPIHLRPKRGLQNYHILWEAEWTKRYPVDPYLLRRFGGDAWLVVAAWDLTEIERAVMASRLNG